jgi:Zinc finger, C3HC4 type (RING finger)
MFANKDKNMIWTNHYNSNKIEKYTLTNTIDKLKKLNDTLQKEKIALEIRLAVAESKISTLLKTKEEYLTVNLPQEIDNLVNMVDDGLKQKLSTRLEKYMAALTCIVCNECMRTCMYIKCSHLVACSNCATKMDSRCPVCRIESKITSVYV